MTTRVPADVHEFKDVYSVKVTSRPRPTYGRPFATIFPDRLAELAQLLSPAALRLYLVLLPEMEYRNRLTITRERVSELAKLAPNHVSTLMRELHNTGALQIESKNPYVIVFNEDFIWKGTVDDYWRRKKGEEGEEYR